MKHFLGVDIGTFETKASLVDVTGRLVAQTSRPHRMLVPRPGWAEHRPIEDWWEDFIQVTRVVLEKSCVDPRDIAGVSASAIGPCMLPVDNGGSPLMNAVLYGVDTRAQAEIEEINARVGASVILERCGNALTSQSIGPKILWLKHNHPELHARAAKFLNSTSYINFRLTGRYAIDHYSAANSGPLYDVAKQNWTFDLADDIARPDQLPDLMWTTQIVGEIHTKAARETGLAPGTPVTAGTIDAAAEALSVGVSNPGDMMMMYGSTIFIIMPTRRPVRDSRLWYAPWLFEGEHVSMAGLATSGTLTHWFRDQFALDLPADAAFAVLAREAAASPPGANGLVMLPYFSGERTPIHDPRAKGCLFGLNLTHTRGDVYRALIEGIAYGANHVIETYREIGHPPNRLLAVGGGTKNLLWLEVTSGITGIEQQICEKTVGASYGDAFLAALATNNAGRSDIRKWNPVANTVQAQGLPVYGERYHQFRCLYEQTKDIAHELG